MSDPESSRQPQRNSLHPFEIARVTYRVARRIVVAVVGGTLVLLGVVLVFTPGPALLVIPAGLAVLALEFTWARHWLRRVARMAERSGDWVPERFRSGPRRARQREPEAAPGRGRESA